MDNMDISVVIMEVITRVTINPRRIRKRQVGQTMQIYNNEVQTSDTQEYIDIAKVLDEIWTEFLRHLGSITVLFLSIVAIEIGRASCRKIVYLEDLGVRE